MHESISLVVSRQTLSELCEMLPKLPDEVAKDVAIHLLNAVQPRAISYEEQVKLETCLKNFRLTEI